MVENPGALAVWHAEKWHCIPEDVVEDHIIARRAKSLDDRRGRRRAADVFHTGAIGDCERREDTSGLDEVAPGLADDIGVDVGWAVECNRKDAACFVWGNDRKAGERSVK